MSTPGVVCLLVLIYSSGTTTYTCARCCTIGNAKGHHVVSSMPSYRSQHGGDVLGHIFRLCPSYRSSTAHHIVAKPQGADEMAGGPWRDKLQSLFVCAFG